MMLLHRALIVSICLLQLGLAGVGRAGTVLEARFDSDKDLPAGSDVTLDHSPADAPKTLTLGSTTTLSAGATGISDKWQAFLTKGYADIGAGTGKGSSDKFGLISKVTGGKNVGWKKYMGFSGLGKAEKQTGGTLYLVVQPKGDWKDVKVKRRVDGAVTGRHLSQHGASTGLIDGILHAAQLGDFTGRGSASRQLLANQQHGGNVAAEAGLRTVDLDVSTRVAQRSGHMVERNHSGSPVNVRAS